ncbi:mycofactocin-coupled SDR family oxidoreductase [Mycobacterium sp. CVI_P3]|uniref:Mycofactocin-coupled SDR family oxidoreductase n=1 Tax=Mycobacterium pinniadriaticum TaxID=2994102 RepID=A0ABT3SP54_9MYCO|nr:mycofactocin-coupled SDR family oxidoreductase [Mycobacterium pinniadriaticum]MCX2934890.1 mycofactocin-coupled SDR family oxidoreductase [Mycobacterium pinniadriaticum]MCX2941312.1 mycofactocin-coupled SDR family oxidoreductase [Mycobacterium pinniadriaticum]
MTGRVEGKVAFITGAARGQGRSHAVRLAEEGADIIAVDICGPVEASSADPSTPEDLAHTADLVKALDRRIVTAEADVRDYGALKAAVDAGVDQLGRLDIVVANAGVAQSAPSLAETDEELWQATLDINLGGVWKTVKAAVPHLLAGGRGGSVILTSSVAGLKPFPTMGHYSVTKTGILGLMRTFAVELGQNMIRVNSVHPSHTNTPMIMHERLYRDFRPDLENPGPEDIIGICQTFHTLPIPWVEPEDVSNAVVFLASDESRYITGVALPVDAGSMLK